ncbi:MAG: hypothetical protein IJT54_01905 [Candidatus Methanomethylophilaceae archaeon]|nr:hypothetical protein [Candidatus Methanomethylophilaceae archaeon]
MNKDGCDPCQFCTHLYDDSDPSVGLYGYGCDAESEWEEGQGVPCPSFRPRLVSDDLLDIIANEQECIAYWENERDDALHMLENELLSEEDRTKYSRDYDHAKEMLGALIGGAY